jgi:exodeoxyribonuclease VIII
MVYNTLIPSEEMTSEEYHGTMGTFSSSQLKTMLEDPEVFYKKYITKEVKKESNSAFDVGTYFHTSLLEPEKVEDECAIYPGPIKRGKEYDAFCETHKGKLILSKTEKESADKLIKAVKESPISMEYLKTSKPEVSAFVELFVMDKEVFSFRDGACYCLMASGWCQTSLDYEPEDIKEFGVSLVIKVRADALGQGTGVISDLKSTTGNAKKPHEMQQKVTAYQYELSAALYLDIFTMASGEDFHTFVWLFASKDMGNARAYKASDKNIMVGRAKWKKAVTELAKYVSNGWAFVDEIGELHPPQFSLEWLQEL